MDSQQIEKMLERYWACETSLEEERTLRSLFKGGYIPENISEYTPFFLVQDEKKNILAGQQLSKSVEDIPRMHSSLYIRYFYPVMRIAASVLIVVSVGLGIYTHHENQTVVQQIYTETCTDPDMAFEEIQHAFDKIGTSFLKAQSALEGLTDSTLINSEQE